MLHIIYKITNLINDKIYIGKHSCESIDDSYMGSGKYIKRAIVKYGIDNFKKEVLFMFDSEKDAYEKEREIVNEDFINRDDVYNLIVGGDSFESINSNIELRVEKNRRAAISMNKVIWSDPEFVERNRKRMSEQTKDLLSKGILKDPPNWKGKKHKDESKIKIGEKNSISQLGERNSQYGKCWVFHREHGSKSIKKSELELYLTDGWVLGRKMT